MRYSFPAIVPIGYEYIRNKFSILVSRVRAIFISWQWGLKIGEGVRFQGKIVVRCRNNGAVKIGNRVVFNSDYKSNLVGLSGPTIIDVQNGGNLHIGDNSGLSSVVISSRIGVRIGSNVKVGGNVRIFDHDYHSLEADFRRTNEDRLHIRSSLIEIGDDCFIGTNAIILKGTKLGPRTIVAAGSVVFGLKAPADSMVKGNPATIILHKERK